MDLNKYFQDKVIKYTNDYNRYINEKHQIKCWLIRLKMNRLRKRFNCDICLGAKIAPNVIIPHAVGIVIGATAQIGSGCIIMPNVVIGSKHYPVVNRGKRHATLGKNILIGANTSIIGNITIGDNVMIGAGSVITADIPNNCVVVGCNRIVKKFNISTDS